MSEPTPVPDDATTALIFRVLKEHVHVDGPYFNLVCTCGHRGVTVSTKHELKAHQAEMIRKALSSAPAIPARYIGVRKAAEILSVSTKTIYRHIASGRLPARSVGSRLLIDPYDLEEAP